MFFNNNTNMIRKAAQLKQFNSANGFIRVEGDVNHTFKTSQFVEGDFKVRFRKSPDSMDDEKVRDWYAYRDTDQIAPHTSEFLGHIPEDLLNETFIETKELALNHSISSLLIVPQSCSNHQECRPSVQATILPYITDAQVYKNIDIAASNEVRLPNAAFGNHLSNGGPDQVFDEPAFEYQYNLGEQRCFFLSPTAPQADPTAGVSY